MMMRKRRRRRRSLEKGGKATGGFDALSVTSLKAWLMLPRSMTGMGRLVIANWWLLRYIFFSAVQSLVLAFGRV